MGQPSKPDAQPHDSAPEPPRPFPYCPDEPEEEQAQKPAVGSWTNDEIAHRERELATEHAHHARLQRDLEAQAKALQVREAALDALKVKSAQLKEATDAHSSKAQTQKREQRKAACEELVNGSSAKDCTCVDKIVAQYRSAIAQHEQYVTYLTEAAERAKLAKVRAQREHFTADGHYEHLHAQAKGCLAESTHLLAKHAEAANAGEHNKMCLYVRAVEELLSEAREHGLDPNTYSQLLSAAFDRLSKARDDLANAQAAQKRLDDELKRYENELRNLRDNRLAVLEAAVSRCCPDPERAVATDSPAKQATTA